MRFHVFSWNNFRIFDNAFNVFYEWITHTYEARAAMFVEKVHDENYICNKSTHIFAAQIKISRFLTSFYLIQNCLWTSWPSLFAPKDLLLLIIWVETAPLEAQQDRRVTSHKQTVFLNYRKTNKQIFFFQVQIFQIWGNCNRFTHSKGTFAKICFLLGYFICSINKTFFSSTVILQIFV